MFHGTTQHTCTKYNCHQTKTREEEDYKYTDRLRETNREHAKAGILNNRTHVSTDGDVDNRTIEGEKEETLFSLYIEIEINIEKSHKATTVLGDVVCGWRRTGDQT